MKYIILIIATAISLQGFGDNIKYVSNSKIMAIYHGSLLFPKCINGNSVENGVDTTCSMSSSTLKRLYFKKENLNRIKKLMKKNTYNNKTIVCQYQALGNMYYDCEPMSDKNKKKVGYK